MLSLSSSFFIIRALNNDVAIVEALALAAMTHCNASVHGQYSSVSKYCVLT